MLGNYVLAMEMVEECDKARDNLSEGENMITYIFTWLFSSVCGGQVLLLHLWVHNRPGNSRRC